MRRHTFDTQVAHVLFDPALFNAFHTTRIGRDARVARPIVRIAA
jgi:hypothetical protein